MSIIRRRPDELPIDSTLARIVVLFRLLGWGWMLLLVALAPWKDPDANLFVVGTAMVLATIWTVVTMWAAAHGGVLDRAPFVVADVTIALLVGYASTLAGAESLLHGGYPMSSLAVVAFAADLRMTLGVAVVLAVEQVVVHVVDERGLIPAAGSVTFLVFGMLMGWGFEEIRKQERSRRATEAELKDAVEAQARHEERLELANRLHDSVLQTLAVLRRDADDAEQVRYLARRQERQLRQTISEYRSEFEHSARAALHAVCADVEDLHRVDIDVVIRGDANLDEAAAAVVAAAREALTNAAKHSGAGSVDLYAEMDDGRVEVFVRDRGRGFDPGRAGAGRGLDHGIRHRLDEIGGTVTIHSEPGAGTEVVMRWQRP